MKKLSLFFVCMIFAMIFVGCAENTSKNEADYVVVDVSDVGLVEELFSFSSVSKKSLSGDLSSMDIEEGVYNIGKLEDGSCILWRADDDKYGYDDGLFVYVEVEIDHNDVLNYASKLKESPISYDEYMEIYN